MDAGKQDLLFLSGFSVAGSDYEIFRNLCRAAERLPGHPERQCAEEQLRTLFGITDPLTPDHCDSIWKRTAEELLYFPLEKSDAERTKMKIKTPCWEQIPPKGMELFEKLPERQAADYAEWKELQTPSVGLRMRLDLPDGFFAESPNLYRVNRHLSGVEPNENLWLCQQARFLCESCKQTGGELLICSATGTEEVPKLLRILAKQVGLPRFCWIWNEK